MTRPTAARISIAGAAIGAAFSALTIATTSSAILSGVVLDSDAQGLSLGLVALGIGILLVVVSRG